MDARRVFTDYGCETCVYGCETCFYRLWMRDVCFIYGCETCVFHHLTVLGEKHISNPDFCLATFKKVNRAMCTMCDSCVRPREAVVVAQDRKAPPQVVAGQVRSVRGGVWRKKQGPCCLNKCVRHRPPELHQQLPRRPGASRHEMKRRLNVVSLDSTHVLHAAPGT